MVAVDLAPVADSTLQRQMAMLLVVGEEVHDTAMFSPRI